MQSISININICAICRIRRNPAWAASLSRVRAERNAFQSEWIMRWNKLEGSRRAGKTGMESRWRDFFSSPNDISQHGVAKQLNEIDYQYYGFVRRVWFPPLFCPPSPYFFRQKDWYQVSWFSKCTRNNRQSVRKTALVLDWLFPAYSNNPEACKGHHLTKSLDNRA